MSDIYAGVGTDDLVTGDAVALDLPAASIGLRALSGLIDVLIGAGLLFVLLFVGLAATAGSDAAVIEALVTVGTALALVGFPTAFETSTRGRSIGKLVVGLRTVRDDAGPISFRHALTRALVGVIEIWLLWGVPALVCALVSPKGKRVGDLLAGTYVVRCRFRLPLPEPVAMPHQLEHWARSADVASLPDGLALAVRQFLGRSAQLNPASREQLGLQLAGQVSRYAAPPPPPGTHPEAFLAAVLAERRDRDYRRLTQESALRQRLGNAVPR